MTIGNFPANDVITGFLATMLLGSLTRPFIEFVRREVKIPVISEKEEVERAWRALVETRDNSGKWVGLFERMIFFGLLLFLLPKEAAPAIGIWLVFKLGAKWEAWHHMGYVPDKVDDVPELTYALGRRIWAAHGYATLVLGTTWNFFAALIGALLIRTGLLQLLAH